MFYTPSFLCIFLFFYGKIFNFTFYLLDTRIQNSKALYYQYFYYYLPYVVYLIINLLTCSKLCNFLLLSNIPHFIIFIFLPFLQITCPRCSSRQYLPSNTSIPNMLYSILFLLTLPLIILTTIISIHLFFHVNNLYIPTLIFHFLVYYWLLASSVIFNFIVICSF